MPDFPSQIDLATPGASGIVFGENDNDKAAWSLSAAGDVNGDGVGDFIVGARYANGNTGAAYVVFGKNGSPPNLDLAKLNPSNGGFDPTQGFMIKGDNSGDAAGFSVSGTGDFNGDGFEDIVIGAPYATAREGELNAAAGAGKVYVVFGKASGFGTIDLGGAPGNSFIVIQGADAGDRLGYSVDFAGDVDGDGFDDLVIGALRGDGPTVGGIYNGGEVYVIFGQGKGTEHDIDLAAGLSTADGYLIQAASPSSYDQFGRSVAGAGDVNGDGLADFIVGAQQADPGGDGDAGAAYVIYGSDDFSGITLATFDSSNPTLDDPSKGFRIMGAAGGDLLGHSVDGAGDVNGDGFDDVIVGIYGGDGGTGDGESGRAAVIFGQAADRTEVDMASLPAGAGFQIIGEDTFDRLGSSVAGAGDVNGDGYDDVIIGAGDADPAGRSTAGAAYVIFGAASGLTTVDLDSALNGSNGFKILGGLAADKAGSKSVSFLGDVNGDGFDDLAIGAPYGDDGGTFGYTGEAHVVAGRAPIGQVTRLGSAGSQTIRGGGSSDTLMGMGGNDVLIGNGGNDTLDGGTGTDTMRGGAGNDTYIIDNAGDKAIETSSSDGIDTVTSALSFTLGAFLDNLTLTGTAITGTGNGGNNTIIGNNANNVLSGGNGIDTLKGSAGNDTLDGGGNNDKLDGGGASDTLFGGIGSDTLDGNTGSDKLNGGSGNDTLIGGSGTDSYFFDTALNASTNVDKIIGFSVADDTILLNRAIFAGITANGTLAASRFHVGTAAADASDRIIYNSGTGQLFYDPDGLGGAAQVLFAKLDPGLALTNADFYGFV